MADADARDLLNDEDDDKTLREKREEFNDNRREVLLDQANTAVDAQKENADKHETPNNENNAYERLGAPSGLSGYTQDELRADQLKQAQERDERRAKADEERNKRNS